MGGTVVRWAGDLWVLAKRYDPETDDRATLMAMDASGITAHPSKTWPYLSYDQEDEDYMKPDPTKTVDTMEWVADNVMSWVKRRVMATFDAFPEGDDED